MKYQVEPGDTMYGIAKRYGVQFAELVELNPQIADPDLVYPGQVIEVPIKESNSNTKANRIFEMAAQLDEILKPLAGMLPPSFPAFQSAPEPVGRPPAYPAGMTAAYPAGRTTAYPAGMTPAYPAGIMPEYFGRVPAHEKPAEDLRINNLQERLKVMGYYKGSITGRIGPKTRSAIRKFQKDCGRPANGVVDTFVRASLGI